jgi:hypothetical protein
MAVSQNLTLTQVSQSISGNTSKVRIRWTSTQTGESWTGYDRECYYYVSINGGAETKYTLTYQLDKQSTVTIVDKTITVNHRADGTATVKVRTYMNTPISVGLVEMTKTLTLDTIPRATTPTLSASSVNMGSTVTINLPRASSSFTHRLYYKFEGGSQTTITTSAGASYTWTVPDKASSIPNATSGQFAIRVDTVSGGSVIGTKWVYLTGKVPTSVVPTISSVAVAEATSGLAAQFKAYIRGKSTLKVTVTSAGAKGSTIKSVKTTFQGKTYTGASFTTDTVTASGSLVTTVTDSRGRTAKKTTVITALTYSKPVIEAFSVYRRTAAGVAADDGTYIAVRYKYTVPSLNGGNTAALAIKYKQSTATSYTNLVTGSALSADTTAKPSSPTFSVDYSYDVQITVTDYFGAYATATVRLSSAEVILDIAADGKGIGLGKTAEGPGIDFGWDIVRQIVGPGSLSGHYRTHDGLLVQWGTVTITPTAAGEPTTALVTFPVPFTAAPNTYLTPITSVPQSLSAGVQRSADLVGDPLKKIAVTLTRSGTTSTGINWLAIGKG